MEHFETVRRRKDGVLIPVSLTVAPIIDGDGVVIGASRIARNISDRKHEEEREQLLAMAQEASRLKDEFLATLSYGLRTPLNAILGYARMMRSGLLPGGKQRRAIETVERNAISLAQIIEDVLDVSRIVCGKIRLSITTRRGNPASATVLQGAFRAEPRTRTAGRLEVNQGCPGREPQCPTKRNRMPASRC